MHLFVLKSPAAELWRLAPQCKPPDSCKVRDPAQSEAHQQAHACACHILHSHARSHEGCCAHSSDAEVEFRVWCVNTRDAQGKPIKPNTIQRSSAMLLVAGNNPNTLRTADIVKQRSTCIHAGTAVRVASVAPAVEANVPGSVLESDHASPGASSGPDVMLVLPAAASSVQAALQALDDKCTAQAAAALADRLRECVCTDAAAFPMICILPAGAHGAAVMRELLRALDLHSSSMCTGITDNAAVLAQLYIDRDSKTTLVQPPQPPLHLAPESWFEPHKPVWQQLLLPARDSLLAADKPARILELGSWEGRSALWLLQNMLQPFQEAGIRGSKLVCVDHFDLLRTDAGKERHAKLQYNLYLSGHADACEVLPDFTVPALTELLRRGCEFDVVYVDASHTRSDTLLDAMLAWRMVAQGGVVIFDDYEWPNHPPDSSQHPREGIDAFVRVHREDLEVLHCGYQLAVRRIAPAFQGFEWRGAAQERVTEAMGPGGAVWHAMAWALVAVRLQSVKLSKLLAAHCSLRRSPEYVHAYSNPLRGYAKQKLLAELGSHLLPGGRCAPLGSVRHRMLEHLASMWHGNQTAFGALHDGLVTK